jgi:hypothetical protein
MRKMSSSSLDSSPSSTGPKIDVAPTPIEPFGEYVRRVFDVHGVSDPAEYRKDENRVALLIPYAATLYLYRSAQETLESVMQELFNIVTSAEKRSGSPADEEEACPLRGGFDCTNVDEWIDHTLGQFQHCIDSYFSTNWHRTPEVVALNDEYRVYIEHLYRTVMGTCSPTAKSPPPSKFLRRGGEIPESELPKVVMHATPLARLDAAIRDGDGNQSQRVIIFFHAPFSTFSTHEAEAVDSAFQTVKQKFTPEPFLAIVNVATQVDVVRAFDIQEYPTLVMLIPAGAHVPCELSDFSKVVYPSDGDPSAESIGAWILSDGEQAPPKMPPKGPRSIAKVSMQKRLEFVARRAAHSREVVMKRLGCDENACVKPRMPTADDPPRFIFLGGGMAAGKTTCTAALSKTDWWKQHGAGVVIVSADEFKFNDSRHSNMKDPKGHEYSTGRAEQLLVEAVNHHRDVVFDSTMMWEPFVQQVVTMVRNVAKQRYRKGPGYQPDKSIEEYFVVDGPREKPFPPYVVELQGSFVDPAKAVPRAIIRELATDRSVPTRQQLKSFKYFARNFEKYVKLCDKVTLFDTNVRVNLEAGEVPAVAARKALGGEFEVLDAESYASFIRQANLNENAHCERELFRHSPLSDAGD